MREGYIFTNQLPGQRFGRVLPSRLCHLQKLPTHQDLCMTVKDDKLKDRQPIVGFKCTGNGGRLDRKQLWTIGGSAPPPPTPAPRPVGKKCGDICFTDSDCDTSGGYGCTRCSGYDVGAHGVCVQPWRLPHV